MSDLKITLIQSKLHWQQPEANRAMFEEKIWDFDKATDIIVLPEMFTTGFSMEASEFAEPMGTGTFKWLQQMAKQTEAAITGSYMVKEQGQYFNRMLWVTPDGNHLYYDKRHLFSLGGEDKVFSEGTDSSVWHWKGWKIRPQICYDLRFPVWSRNKVKDGKPEYDLLLNIANWPVVRISAWDVLLRARSVENTCYGIGLNRIGKDGNGLEYVGHSAVIGPKGDEIYDAGDKNEIFQVNLSLDTLNSYREKFPVHLDSDNFSINFE